MNSVIEVLYLRRPTIDYVSPAICEVDFSSSGGPIIILNPLPRLVGPTGLVLGSGGHSHRLSWNAYPGALCYSIYKLVDELDPFGPYQLIAECISDNFIDLTGPGHYRVTVITPDGETPFSEPFNAVFPNPPVPPVNPTIEAISGLDTPLDFSDDAIIAGYTNTGVGVYWKSGIATTLDFGGGAGSLECANNGRVGGASIDGGSNVFGLWDTIGSIPVQAGADVEIQALNNSGIAAGTGGFGTIAYRYVDGVGLTNLGNLGTDASIGAGGAATGPFKNRTINAVGQIAVSSRDSAGIPISHACRWFGGVLTNITPPFAVAGDDSWSTTINTAGHIAGVYQLSSTTGQLRGFFYDGAIHTDFAIGLDHNIVYSLNDNDQVCGVFASGGQYHAMWWEAGFGAAAVTEFPGTTVSEAFSINNTGWIVGYMISAGISKAFLFKIDENEVLNLYDLLSASDKAHWDSLEQATFVNNNKQIVGFGTFEGVPLTVFLITLP